MRFGITRVCHRLMDVRKQSAVSHSSAESEIISFDAGQGMDGLPKFGMCLGCIIQQATQKKH